ncbi:aminotransferase DegT [Clostridia bacterium]|nr:aminotransferase DegT [Clostridia bacterium]
MQFRDLGEQYRRMKYEIDSAINEVILDGRFIMGPKVSELENILAAYVGVKHCVSCANGTDALQLVLMAWGIGEGDAVFTSDFTYFASAGASSILGATSVLVDIDLRTFNINPNALEIAIQKTLHEGKLTPRVIIPVDLFGLPASYESIEPIAKKYGLRILEDGAQGFGGNINGKRVGSFGDAATTSFFPAKPLGCYGDGGAIFTDDDNMNKLLRSLRAQGRSPEDKYDNRIIGMNSRLDTLQAAILIPKFRALVKYEWEQINKVAESYTNRLCDVVTIPLVPEGYCSSWAQYTILLENETQRNELQKHLKERGIPSMVYYPRGLHQQSAYSSMKLSDDYYPNTIDATRRVLSLPMHPYLEKSEVELIANRIAKFLYKRHY